MMTHQVTLEEAAGHLSELVRQVRNGQDVVLLQDRLPVARLVALSDDAPTAFEMAQLAMAGGAFNWLADEPDLYDDTCGEAIQ